MHNSTHENLEFRIMWLREIVESNISVSSQELLGLSNMRSFCELSKKGWFKKLSYNALKQEAWKFTPDKIDVPDVTDYWQYLLDLRLQANEKLSITNRQNGLPDLPNPEELAKKSLMEAHLCAMAYLEIFRFLENLTTKQISSTEELQQLITNHLSVSAVKFKIITSFADIETDRTELKLIQGGKKR